LGEEVRGLAQSSQTMSCENKRKRTNQYVLDNVHALLAFSERLKFSTTPYATGCQVIGNVYEDSNHSSQKRSHIFRMAVPPNCPAKKKKKKK
jgi:hypothetical protein